MHTRTLAALATAAALTGCTSSHPPTASRPAAAKPGPALDPAALAALADQQNTTALPPSTVTTRQIEQALAATLPPPTATAGYDAASVKSALAFTAKVVTATRLNKDYLCGPQSASPATALSTPYLKTYLAKPGNGRPIEVTLGSVRKRDDCGTLRWVGPGVVLGKQTWTLGTVSNGDLLVRWTGTGGYALADSQGHPEPWRLTGHAGYQLARQGSGWALNSWTPDTNTSLYPGWLFEVPIPPGYLPVPAVPAGNPDALTAVHAAAAK